MKYCSACGAQVEWKIPEGDSLPRYVCPACHTIHYQNPKIIAGCIPQWGGQVLLCRRAIEPRHGYWTLPAGFMENGESVAEAAARETWEEAGAVVTQQSLYGVFSIPHINQVYLMFRGELPTPTFAPGVESLDVRLFAEADIPWEELAFSVVKRSLEYYFNDRVGGDFPLRLETLRKRP